MKKWLLSIATMVIIVMTSLFFMTVSIAKTWENEGKYAAFYPVTGDNTPMIITIVVIVLIAAGVGIGALVAINRRRWL